MIGSLNRGQVRPNSLVVKGRVALDVADPERALSFVARLRELHSAATDVTWHATIGPDFPIAELVHLPPPQPDDEPTARWRAAHKHPAMFHYRLGPGFIEIRDTRRAHASARFILDDAALIETFTRCLRPHHIADLAPPAHETVGPMLDEHILLCVGEWVTTLPSRMRRWPIPSQIV